MRRKHNDEQKPERRETSERTRTTATASAPSTSCTERVVWKATMLRVYTTITRMQEMKMAKGRFLRNGEENKGTSVFPSVQNLRRRPVDALLGITVKTYTVKTTSSK